MTKVATIDDGDIFTNSHAETLNREFTEMGGEVVLPTPTMKQNMMNSLMRYRRCLAEYLQSLGYVVFQTAQVAGR